MRIDRARVTRAFASYVKNYDPRDEKIKLKIIHTYQVAKLCEKIAESLKLPSEDVDLAWLLGMLHDVGRFEQLRRYGTFVDAQSIDHAKFGAGLLFGEEWLIGDYLEISREQRESWEDTLALIRTAIEGHSAYRLPEHLSPRTRMFCDILRDADKIDILRVNVEVPLEEIYNTTTEELKSAAVTPEVMEAFSEEHAVLRALKKTPVDNVVGHMALVFELVYPISVRLVRQQGYLDQLMNFSSDCEQTRRQFEQLRGHMKRYMKRREKEPVTKAQEVELGLRKKFHKQLFTKFAKAINTYDLLQPNDKVAVCISGGKDSMLMAKLFQELQHHNKFPFELVFLSMDPGYADANRKLIEENAAALEIPLTIFESQIFDAVYEIRQSPCYLCARMRRGYLYSKAKELGCNKIALGHHYDDVIETILMGMLYGGQVQTMMPKLHSTNFEGMELIRPMYLIREADICHWRDYHGLRFLQCACRFTEEHAYCREDGSSDSKRREIKELIARLKEVNPYVEGNIFKSVENVNLRTIIAYKKDGVKHSFLEDYDG